MTGKRIAISGTVLDKKKKYLIVQSEEESKPYFVIMSTSELRAKRSGDRIKNLECITVATRAHLHGRFVRTVYDPVLNNDGKARLTSLDEIRQSSIQHVREIFWQYRNDLKLVPKKYIDRMRVLGDVEYLEYAKKWRETYFRCKRLKKPIPEYTEPVVSREPYYTHIYVSKEEGDELRAGGSFKGCRIEKDGVMYVISYGKHMDSPTIGEPETERFDGEYYNLFCRACDSKSVEEDPDDEFFSPDEQGIDEDEVYRLVMEQSDPDMG